ncbi:MAG: TonB-dependent receptor [Rikenellaceae bacterium]
MKQNKLFLILALMLSATQMISAMTLRGKVLDQETGEPLLGAAVMVKGTTMGASTGFDGDFELKVDPGQQIVVSYISYVTQEMTTERGEKEIVINLVPDSQTLESVEVVTKVNLETEANLQRERLASHIAIESIGVREMSLKGLSNAEDGVKKMTGISVAGAGQIIVRGLGDRYSITTLNGQPIASPNPDNKLIPLDIFPSSAISSINVSKVYDAKAYADYAGAHIDINTKNVVYDNFVEFGVTVGGNTLTTGKDLYMMDTPSIFSKSTIDSGAAALTNNFAGMSSYINENDVFDSSFMVTESTALPKMAGNVAWGHTYDVGNQNLTLMATAMIDNDYQVINGAEEATLRVDGTRRSDFTYDSYSNTLKIAAMATAGISLRDKDYISYTMFYARNAKNECQDRRGWTYDVEDLVGSINISTIYGLITNQLHGEHYLSDRWSVNYNASYSITNSDEPDRRQVMYQDNGDGTYALFKEDQNETMRYFADLDETDLNGQFATDYKFGADNKHTFSAGVAYKTKNRSFDSSSYYYNYGSEASGGFIAPTITDTHSPSFLNYDNIGYDSGEISLTYERYPNDYYDAYSNILSAFFSMDLNITEAFLMTAGLRLESSEQGIEYGTESSTSRLEKVISADDLFPALNLRYKFAEKSQLRFAASRTITRPSFIEMAPFSYEPSYGSGIVKGNSNIQNAYNYNVDLRYEAFFNTNDMISATVYFKYLDTPIERIQLLSTTDPYTSFDNADDGTAAGVEFEFRKALSESFRLGGNATYMYTNVNLSEGAQTNDSRMLQGASPYLVNLDLAYMPSIQGERPLSLVLLYSYCGERIYSVGVDGLGDTMELATNELDFVASYKLNDKMSLKLEVENLLNQNFVCEQIIPDTDQRVVVENYEVGISAKVGFSMKF